MENISWSEEQVLAVVNEFNDKMEELRKQAPKFQHIDFVKFALIYLTREGLTTNLLIEDVKDKKVGSVLQYFNEVMADSNFKLKPNNEQITYTLKEAILEIYSNTIKVIPFEVFIVNYFDSIFIPLGDFWNNRIEEFNVLSSYKAYGLNDKSLYIKGYCAFSALLTKLEDPKSIWDNKIAIEFDDFDDLFIFDIIYGARISTIQDKIVFINQAPFDGNQKIDLYIDMTFDFNKTSSVLEQLTLKGKVVAGVNEHVIKGDNQIVRELFDDRRVQKVHTNGIDNGWIEFGIEKYSLSPFFYSSDHDLYREIETEEIIRYGYSLDYERYEVFEKVDGFMTTIADNLQNLVEGYEASTASLFLIPYFKKHYKGVLSTLIDEFTYPDFKTLEDNCIKRHEGEKAQVIRAFNFCISQIGRVDYYSDAKYQHFLNAIRMIETIDDNIFHKYYSEIIERICERVVRSSYTSQYQFIESQIGNADDLQIVVRKDDYADIIYPGDSGIDELTSYAGWGSVITPKTLKGKSVEIEMAFDIDAEEFYYDPVCSASQYVIFDAMRGKNKSQYVRDIAIPICDVADVVIDLHKDIRQYETISKSHLKHGGLYVTFVMKKDLGLCQPVIEKLIKENVLDKVISLNNRYLLFINQSKQDDKVVLAKFNHIDDERFSEFYQSIIYELSFEDGTPHVLILSNSDLASKKYSISTDDYFYQHVEDIEAILKGILSRFQRKYKLIDLLLNISLRVESLFSEGHPILTFNSAKVNKLDDVIDYMKEYEEILMENYDECIDLIIRIFASERVSYKFLQPEIAQLMVDLHSSDKIHNLFNPYAGTATFANLIPDANYIGNEINSDIHTLGTIRLNAGNLVHTGYTCEDSHDFVKSLPKEVLYDTILSIPPFLPDKEALMYDFLFNQCMSHLEEQGKMMVAVPSSFMFNHSKKITGIRKTIVDNRWIEKVIALPKGSFLGMNVSVCLIQLSKRDNQEILFCDMTQMFESHKSKVSLRTNDIIDAIMNKDADCCFSTPYAEIRNNNYSLNIFLYKPFPEQVGVSTYRLGDLLTKIEHKHFSENSGLTMSRDKLSSDAMDFRRTKFDLKLETLDESMLQIQGDALILSSFISDLKPTFVDADITTTYYISRNTLAFKVNQAIVMPDYLCYALRLPEVMQQIDNYRTGILACVSSEDFLSIRINLPELSSQKSILDEIARQQYTKEKQAFNKKYIELNAEKEEEFKSLKHAMGKSVAGINAAVDNLYNYFEKTGLLDKIVQTRRNTTVADKLNVIKDSIHHIEILMQNGADFLDVSQYPLSSVSISEIWSNVQYENEKFTVDKSEILPQSMSEVSVRMNLDLFKILINDVMSNAEKHAFFDNDPANVVRVEISSDNAWLTLLISNNGKPFPDDVDVQKFTKRHWSAGEHRGSGIGGHDIQKIVKAFQGEFELIPDYKETFPTCYVLRFPIE